MSTLRKQSTHWEKLFAQKYSLLDFYDYREVETTEECIGKSGSRVWSIYLWRIKITKEDGYQDKEER